METATTPSTTTTLGNTTTTIISEDGGVMDPIYIPMDLESSLGKIEDENVPPTVPIAEISSNSPTRTSATYPFSNNHTAGNMPPLSPSLSSSSSPPPSPHVGPFKSLLVEPIMEDDDEDDHHVDVDSMSNANLIFRATHQNLNDPTVTAEEDEWGFLDNPRIISAEIDDDEDSYGMLMDEDEEQMATSSLELEGIEDLYVGSGWLVQLACKQPSLKKTIQMRNSLRHVHSLLIRQWLGWPVSSRLQRRQIRSGTSFDMMLSISQQTQPVKESSEYVCSSPKTGSYFSMHHSTLSYTIVE
eukprot:scaffold6528_cov114-Cylindrotheca_fusiformis.AAC.14